ncbi:MAG TPA: trimeric intracellular cation channel family protein [Candidatus Saccharimonadales bacterium]|nr:trimeric intracellular cation channel family protein [Candidatus Saccharimonadales bacterium]
MNFQDLLHISDLLGTFAFAISGALVAVRKKMDIFGVIVLATVTATGGGTLRSFLIGDQPVFILKNISYLIVCLLGALLVFYFKEYVRKRSYSFLLFDAFGLAVFLSIGTAIGLQHGLGSWASVLMGMMTAAFGGVIRDVLADEVPLILRKELYAILALAGGLVYVVLYHFNLPEAYIVIISSGVVFVGRILAIRYDWSLPKS